MAASLLCFISELIWRLCLLHGCKLEFFRRIVETTIDSKLIEMPALIIISADRITRSDTLFLRFLQKRFPSL